MLGQAIACHWTARRIQRYLDADPSAPLTPGEIVRLEAHLEACERCREVARQHRLLHRALARWARSRPVDPAAVQRLRGLVDDLAEGRHP